MTPKEKAQELLSTYRYALSLPNAPLGENKDAVAKLCASITVDEIVDSIVITDLTIAENQFLYWEEVKEELKQL
jgi:hypothetical protein